MEAAFRFITSINEASLNSIRILNFHLCAKMPLYLRGPRTEREGVTLETSIEEDRWEHFWQQLSKTRGLTHVYLKIFDYGFVLLEDIFLKPLRDLQIDELVVQLPWPWGFVGWRDVNPDPEYHGVSGEGWKMTILRPSRQNMVGRSVRARRSACGKTHKPLPCWTLVLFLPIALFKGFR